MSRARVTMQKPNALPQSPLCGLRHNGAYFPGSTRMGLFHSLLNLLGILHSDVRDKQEYPMILFQLKSKFTTKAECTHR